jgi:HNH endonuclease
MNGKKKLPSKEALNKLLRYEPSTGLLFWRKRTVDMFVNRGGHSLDHTCAKWNGRFADKEALVKMGHGYRCGRLNRDYVMAHRVIWKLMTDVDPIQVDHIDGDRSNNRWENLRDVTASENRRNTARRSNNTSGVVGVHWNKQIKKWSASIVLKTVYLGAFDSFDEAVAARNAAAVEYGFHTNHGREAVKINAGSDPSPLAPLPY